MIYVVNKLKFFPEESNGSVVQLCTGEEYLEYLFNANSCIFHKPNL